MNRDRPVDECVTDRLLHLFLLLHREKVAAEYVVRAEVLWRVGRDKAEDIRGASRVKVWLALTAGL